MIELTPTELEQLRQFADQRRAADAAQGILLSAIIRKRGNIALNYALAPDGSRLVPIGPIVPNQPAPPKGPQQ